MSVFAIVLVEQTQDEWASVKEHWPDRHYILSKRIAFVAPENGTVLTGEIADKVGMNKEEQITGFVMKSAANSGFANAGLWEWMKVVE